jgi:uncharacterized protein YbjT (DUF2867 family)
MGDARLSVAVTGATGFVGRHVLLHLLDAGHDVRALVRDADQLTPREWTNVTAVTGDLFSPAALRRLVEGADAVVHLVGIIAERPARGQTFERIHVEGTSNLLAAARGGGVRRWVHMSALGARPEAPATYHRTKYEAEQRVRGSGLQWTIFRPSLIHGPDGEFMRMVRGFCTGWFPPFLPYFGKGLLGNKGGGSLQPIWVEDVARYFTAALGNARSIGQVYGLGGPTVHTWPALYELCRDVFTPGSRRRPRGVPVWYAKLIAGLPGVPFNRDQVLMSQEDNVCAMDKALADFDIQPADFAPTLAQYAPHMTRR